MNAKERFPELYEYSDFILQEDLNFHFHFPEDPRVTRVGKFCRRTSIDELPNFINVVMGDMSMVGPRPEIPEMFDGYYGYKEGYTSVKPGITSLSKCTGRDSLTKRETLELDINYIYDQTVISDLQIIWKTMVAVIIRKHVH